MSVKEWSRSTVGYGRRLVHSTLDGVRIGEDQFRKGGQLTPYFGSGARRSLSPAVIGIILGTCLGYRSSDRRRAVKALVGGVLGGLIGFSAGMTWETRQLAASVGSSVRKNVQFARDEHWLQQHPIDYA